MKYVRMLIKVSKNNLQQVTVEKYLLFKYRSVDKKKYVDGEDAKNYLLWSQIFNHDIVTQIKVKYIDGKFKFIDVLPLRLKWKFEYCVLDVCKQFHTDKGFIFIEEWFIDFYEGYKYGLPRNQIS